MNIKELKEYIKDLPDDMEVWVEWASYLIAWIKSAHIEWNLFALGIIN